MYKVFKKKNELLSKLFKKKATEPFIEYKVF